MFYHFDFNIILLMNTNNEHFKNEGSNRDRSYGSHW